MAETVQAHPMALIHYDTLKNEDAKRSIAQLTVGLTIRPNILWIGSPRRSRASQPRAIRLP